MKKINLLFLSALCAGALSSCSGSHENSSTDSSSVKTDSITTTTVKTDSSVSSPGMSDTAFANRAAVGGMAEVALGKLAAANGASKDVRKFGSMMVMDHGKANEELMSIAKRKNITLPASPDAEHQAKSDSLSKLSGKKFDIAYVQAMVDGHRKTLELMKSEASGGKDAELKAFAAKTAPVVLTHLARIRQIRVSIK